ncbi:MAG TPA: electron transfer flavoprotein subunit alpha/FixB family protein, partial [Myxococcaceae bacterium]|nr:electron transfer flavoprotein subunit alpha/FixB family protein [Myxococcaceae bacterium]
MSTVLIVAEAQPDGHLRKATFHALAAGKDLAQKTGAALHLVVLAENPSALAEQLKPYGAAVIHTVASPAFAHYVAESFAPAVAALASSIGADFLGAAATAQGRDL